MKHFARTGVLTKEYQNRLREALNYKGEGVEFSPATGHSVADVIGTAYDGTDGHIEFLDSYKTMAKVTISKLQEGTKQSENLTQSITKGMVSGSSVFEAIKPLLPGGEFIDAGDTKVTIAGAIRNLFKDPFMIFNYSASIGRIVKNLGNNVAHDVAKSIATADFSDKESEGVKVVAKNLVDSVSLVLPDKTAIKTADDLKKALKNYKLSDIKVKKPFVVEVPAEGKKAAKVKNLEEMLEATVKSTYGEVVKEVFKESFEPFVKVQDSMNDTFKIAFRIFDKKRVDMLRELQKSKPDRFISKKDHARVLEDLWDDFPWIVGPLSGAKNKKDVISVVTTSTRASNVIEESRKKPQTVLNESKEHKTRTVTPLVKYLEEAVSAGSVLPFHAIDGAEIAKSFIAMDIKSMAAIHDAIIPPLNRSDDVGFQYQKGMVETNTNYILSDAINGLVTRINTTIENSDFDKDFQDVTVRGLKTLESDKVEFPAAAKEVTGKMKTEIDHINTEREKWYGDGGKLEGAYYGNLVGTPGGMYRAGFTDENGEYVESSSVPDLAYKEKFRKDNLYKSTTIENRTEEVVKEPTETVADEKQLKKDQSRVDMIMARLEKETKKSGSKLPLMIHQMSPDLQKAINDDKLNIELWDKAFAEYNNRIGEVNETTGVKDAIADLISGIDKTKGCK